MIRTVVFVFALLTLVLSVCGEILSFRECPESSKCRVTKIQATPCRMAEEVCKLKRGKNATIEIDFTPDFDASSFIGKAFWANGLIDLPLAGMETNACHFTTCPIVKGKDQSYKYNLILSRSFPTGGYDVKWKLYNEANADQVCCGIFKIKLLR